MLPDFDFTRATSEALIEPPLAFTSRRKFAAVTVCPDCAFTCATSEAVTEPLLFVSPARTRIRTATLLVLVPSLTFRSVTVIGCTSVTPVRSTATTLVEMAEGVTVLATPDVTAAPLKVTGAGKVKITL